MLTARAALAALLLLPIVAPTGAEAGDLQPGTYLSRDDIALNEQGLYTRVWEYVTLGRDASGDATIETGFVGGRVDPVGQLESAASQADAASAAAVDFGRLDLMNASRIALTGSLTVSATELSWTADSFAATTHAPGWIAVEAEPRPSPFLQATAASDTPALSYAVAGDTVTVFGAAGTAHAYQLYDPLVHQIAGAIGEDVTGRVFADQQCLWAMAEDVVSGAPDALSDAALAATRTQVEAAGGDAAAAWQMITQRGPTDVLFGYLTAQLDGRQHVARYLQALIDQDGGLDAMFARYAQLYAVLDVAQSDVVTVMDRYHYFDFEPQAGELPWIRDVLPVLVARYDEDPWSLTGLDAVREIAPDGWVTQIRLALSEEMKLRCADSD